MCQQGEAEIDYYAWSRRRLAEMEREEMKKIWDAAKAMDYRLTDEDSAFVQGARWALEQMTSEAAVKAAQTIFETEWDVNQEYARQMADSALVAVRKEIES